MTDVVIVVGTYRDVAEADAAFQALVATHGRSPSAPVLDAVTIGRKSSGVARFGRIGNVLRTAGEFTASAPGSRIGGPGPRHSPSNGRHAVRPTRLQKSHREGPTQQRSGRGTRAVMVAWASGADVAGAVVRSQPSSACTLGSSHATEHGRRVRPPASAGGVR